MPGNSWPQPVNCVVFNHSNYTLINALQLLLDHGIHSPPPRELHFHPENSNSHFSNLGKLAALKEPRFYQYINMCFPRDPVNLEIDCLLPGRKNRAEFDVKHKEWKCIKESEKLNTIKLHSSTLM